MFGGVVFLTIFVITKTNSMIRFMTFLQDCEVLELEHNKEYDIVYNQDNEVMVKVLITDTKGWSITEVNGIDVWNDPQKELLFCKIDEVLNSTKIIQEEPEELYYPKYNSF